MACQFNPTFPLEQQLTLLLPGAWACQPDLILRPCLNFIRPSWNGWNGTRLFVVVRSIPTCFQVFVSIPTTKRKSWNSCELSAIGNILDCQYKTLGTIVTHRLQVGCLEHTHAPLPPLLFPFSRHDYSAARTHACLLYTSPSPRDGLLSRMPSSA